MPTSLVSLSLQVLSAKSSGKASSACRYIHIIQSRGTFVTLCSLRACIPDAWVEGGSISSGYRIGVLIPASFSVSNLQPSYVLRSQFSWFFWIKMSWLQFIWQKDSKWLNPTNSLFPSSKRGLASFCITKLWMSSFASKNSVLILPNLSSHTLTRQNFWLLWTSDTYMSTSILQAHQSFLNLFMALPFRLSSAPWVFINMLATALALHGSHGIFIWSLVEVNVGKGSVVLCDLDCPDLTVNSYWSCIFRNHCWNLLFL